MTRSLRLQLLAGIVGGMALLLIVFSLTVYTAIRRALIDQFERALVSSARMLAASVERDGNQVELGFDAEQIREFNDVKRPTYYEMWRSDGSVAAKSPSLGRTDLMRFEGVVGRDVFKALPLGDDQPGRAVSFRFVPRLADTEGQPRPESLEKTPFTLVVARSTHDVQEQLEYLRSLLLMVSAGTVGLSLLVGGVVVGRGLRPLKAFAAQIAAIREDNLSTRVMDLSTPAEIEPIRTRLNDLLTRLEASFNRERRFAADVAHELRTPLAGMRSTLEVTLTRRRNAEEYQTSLEDCLAIAVSMQAMVNNLLMLARIDANQVTFQFEPVRAAELVDSCWRPYAGAAARRAVEFENRLPADMTLESDASCLSMVFSNLLDNAVEYVNQAGRIWVTGSQTGDSVELVVSNTGCQLTGEQVSQVFDCFWRGDPSRTGTGTHCGLGLALVRKIVSSLSGRVSADVQAGEVFVVRLVLPMHAAEKGTARAVNN
jgi:two-component system, OmpR family, heavy metal sensor histidine kinase CusS